MASRTKPTARPRRTSARLHPPGESVATSRPEQNERPHPPGDYPLVVVGSGPGGLQVSYFLSHLGVRHAHISADPSAGGMFRRFPIFQRLLSWTRPYAPYERATRYYESFDWNSLLAEEPANRSLMPEIMDGVSEFPSRPEMERNLALFAEKTGRAVRYDTRWTGTRREGERFVLETSDGEYRADHLVFATGAAEPWKPATPGIEAVPHYADTGPAQEYAGKRVFIVGKMNSGFELAEGLLPWAKQIVLCSPRDAKLSVVTRSLVGIRARYLQPYEDHALGGGIYILNAAIERIEHHAEGWRVFTRSTLGGADLTLDADVVIAATGFGSPLGDLAELGVGTFNQGKLPVLTPFWESATVPGIYFAGTIGQAMAGLKKHGVPANSGAVQGARYNARVLAEHIARTHYGWQAPRPAVAAKEVVPYLLSEATHGPELWHQRSYLARLLSFDEHDGIRDEGIWPLADFVDSSGGAAVAMTLEHTAEGEIRPAVYVRREGKVEEHVMPSDPLLDFESGEHRKQLRSLLSGLPGLRG
jgi:thioredoxin reductase